MELLKIYKAHLPACIIILASLALCLSALSVGADPAAIIPIPSDTSLQAASISVDWSKRVSTLTPMLFGTNDSKMEDPTITAQDPVVAKTLDELGIRIIRIHAGGLANTWSVQSTHGWNTARISAAYAAPYLKGRTVIQNMPHWPGWMKTDPDGTLDPSDIDNYAAFCAGLVKIVNVDLKMHVRYWEPQNEWDGTYSQAGKISQIWPIYNACAVAMKKVDPSVKVGGIAMSWDDPAKIREFVRNCGPNIDFISFHRYGSGNATDSTDQIMTSAMKFGSDMKAYPGLVKQVSGGRSIPLILDEFSVDYSWDSGETRQFTNVGAVWYASVLRNIAYAGMKYALNWSFKEGPYGLIDMDDHQRPVAQLYKWGTHYLIGDLVSADSTNSRVEAMAILGATNEYSLLLINTASGPATVQLDAGRMSSNVNIIHIERLNHTGRTSTDSDISLLSRPITMPPCSLMLIAGTDHFSGKLAATIDP